MKLKTGVKTAGIRPEILLALFIADKVWTDNGKELVVTSITDGKHSLHSKHYPGLAVDLRTRYFLLNIKVKVAGELRLKLGKDYHVLMEKTHIHLSYKPKR